MQRIPVLTSSSNNWHAVWIKSVLEKHSIKLLSVWRNCKVGTLISIHLQRFTKLKDTASQKKNPSSISMNAKMVSIVDLFSVLLLLLNQALCKDWLKSGRTLQSFSESCSHLSGKNQTHILVKRWYGEFIKTPDQRRVKGGSRGRIEPLIVALSLFALNMTRNSMDPLTVT